MKKGKALFSVSLGFVLVAVAGCSSDGGSSDTTVKETTTTVALTGPPIKVGAIQNEGQPQHDQNVAGAKAAIAAINAAGGINGSPLEYAGECTSLEGKSDTSAKCARDVAGDASIVALVGSNDNYGDQVNPELEKAGLASIGQSMFGLADFKSPMVFPADGGSVSGAASGGPICFNEFGGKSLALGYIDSPAGAQTQTIFDAFVLKPYNTKLVAVTPVPLAATDLSAQAAKLIAADPDCIFLADVRESVNRFVPVLLQQGYKGVILYSGQVHSEATMNEGLGDDAEGNVITIGYDPASEGYKQYKKDLEATYGSKYVDFVSDQGAKAWLSVKIFAEVAAKLTTVDRASVADALAKATVNAYGMVADGTFDYTKRVADPAVFGGLAPNLIKPYAMAGQMKNGKIVIVSGKWENAFLGPNQ